MMYDDGKFEVMLLLPGSDTAMKYYSKVGKPCQQMMMWDLSEQGGISHKTRGKMLKV